MNKKMSAKLVSHMDSSKLMRIIISLHITISLLQLLLVYKIISLHDICTTRITHGFIKVDAHNY